AWCRAGHSVVIVRGNHDPEWAGPGGRRALLALLGRAGAGRLGAGQVRFRSRVHRRANVHIEHGHEVDWLTRAERDFSDAEPARLRLPFGSLISRYVLNVLERRVPPRAPLPPSGRLVEALHPQPWRLLPAIVTNALRAIPFIGLSVAQPGLAAPLRRVRPHSPPRDVRMGPCGPRRGVPQPGSVAATDRRPRRRRGAAFRVARPPGRRVRAPPIALPRRRRTVMLRILDDLIGLGEA